ncbi:hypothetical protein RQP46_010991 [Phenoliferia psychrophenolica]
MKTPRLAQLDKATTRLTFRSLAYGSPPSMLFPSSPIVSASFTSPLFSLRAFLPNPASSSPSPSSSSKLKPSNPRPRSPSSLLPSPPPSILFTTSSDPANPLLPSQDALRARQLQLKRYRKPFTMDLTILVGKKNVHKSAVIRDTCKRRLREAIRLVVLRGAAQTPDGDDVAFDSAREGPRKWLVPGLRYVAAIPNLEIYRHPLPALVETVRTALLKLKATAEDQIINRELARIEAPPPPLPAQPVNTGAEPKP